MPATDETRAVVDAYSYAWIRGDIDEARTYLADDLRFRGSIDSFDRAHDFTVTLGEFAKLVTDVEILDRYYREGRAALLFDCVTDTEAGRIRSAEFFQVAESKITGIRLVFDATVLRRIMAQ
jgi:hypothetical protein